MALSSQFPLCPSKFTSPKTLYIPTAPNATKLTTKFQPKPLRFAAIAKASQEEDKNASIAKASKEEDNSAGKIAGSDAESQSEKSRNEEMAEIGLEIKKAMMERGQNGEAGFFSGVAEEIREIEWPSFGKVVGTTGVVLGVIAGSSVVLLTVNAVLAELSDRVFAGKGVQDFFG